MSTTGEGAGSGRRSATVLRSVVGPYLKPLPEISELDRPFWDALREHRFCVARCRQCGEYNWVRYPACRTCWSEDQEWTEVSGDATLFTFTVVHRGPGAFDADVPYVVALGELVERPRPCLVLANLVEIEPAAIRVGMPLRIAYEDIPDEDVTLYRWVPRSPGRSR
jgi:hypothetical protein